MRLTVKPLTLTFHLQVTKTRSALPKERHADLTIAKGIVGDTDRRNAVNLNLET